MFETRGRWDARQTVMRVEAHWLYTFTRLKLLDQRDKFHHWTAAAAATLFINSYEEEDE